MPALIFLGRAWAFASDDFVLSAAVDAVFKFCFILIIGVPFLCITDASLCLPNNAIKGCLGASLVILLIMIVLDIYLSISSSKGGVMESNLRVPVPRLLVGLLILSFAELAFHCANIYYATTIISTCDAKIVNSFIAGNSLGLIHTINLLFLLVINYRTTGGFLAAFAKENRHIEQGFLPPSTNVSTKRLMLLQRSESVRKSLRKVGLFRGPRVDRQREAEERRAISAAAALFSEIFYDVNLVVSDIVAGLLLLRWQTNQWIGPRLRVPMDIIEEVTVPSSLSLDDLNVKCSTLTSDSDWLNIRRIYRVTQLAVACYGKYFYCSAHCCDLCAVCRLCKHIPCCPPCGRSTRSANINSCICANHTCDVAALLESTSLSANQFLKISFENSLYQSPYFVALDDESKCIVISIRGTLSFEDAIVDLLYDGTHLDEVESFVEAQTGSRPCFIGHRGVVESARHLYNSLKSEGIIESAMLIKPDYDLIVCGHSLGAGIASFLAIILHCTYPKVKGYAISSPLGMMNRELANYAKPFLLSLIYGLDIFARMNKSTISDFKWRLIDALCVCKVPKHRILSRGICLYLRRKFLKHCSSCFDLQHMETIGGDSRLFDTRTQQQLIYPSLQWTFGENTINISPSANTSNSDNIRRCPNRLRSESRSLICWINSEDLHLFKTEEISDFNSNPTSNSYGENMARTDPCDLSDGTFGGVVLHLVKVNVEETGSRQQVFPSGDTDDRTFLAYLSGQSSALHLISSNFNSRSNCARESSKSPIIAVWSDDRQFQTILVHPRMLYDHFPDKVLEAVGTLHDALLGLKPTNNLKSQQLIRKLKTLE